VYDIVEEFKNGYDWTGAKVFADLLNTELARQGIAERVYLINGGNEVQLFFLTPELYRFIDTFLADRYWKPLEPETWARVMPAHRV